MNFIHLRLITVTSMLCLSSFLISADQREEIDPQELEKKLYHFEFHCEEAHADEITAITKYLQDNPNIKNEHRYHIELICANAKNKANRCDENIDAYISIAESYGRIGWRHHYKESGEALAHAKGLMECRRNCRKVYRKFKNLLKQNEPTENTID